MAVCATGPAGTLTSARPARLRSSSSGAVISRTRSASASWMASRSALTDSEASAFGRSSAMQRATVRMRRQNGRACPAGNEISRGRSGCEKLCT